ncbi:hypothetical protein [Mesoflavibacter sp.]|uniref:hypothetical protein n=1 Tax=Mesoflavibacter sp. TaxID=1930902 RepID=UPI0035156EA2
MRKLYKTEEFPVCEIQKLVNDVNSHINHIKNNYSYDAKSSELLNWISEKLNSISKIARREVRFDYLFIQSEIDKLYKKDNTLTGVVLILNFKKLKSHNRGFLEFNLTKN